MRYEIIWNGYNSVVRDVRDMLYIHVCDILFNEILLFRKNGLESLSLGATRTRVHKHKFPTDVIKYDNMMLYNVVLRCYNNTWKYAKG